MVLLMALVYPACCPLMVLLRRVATRLVLLFVVFTVHGAVDHFLLHAAHSSRTPACPCCPLTSMFKEPADRPRCPNRCGGGVCVRKASDALQGKDQLQAPGWRWVSCASGTALHVYGMRSIRCGLLVTSHDRHSLAHSLVHTLAAQHARALTAPHV